MNKNDKLKICIIGAGLSGLTAAYRLGEKGHDVTVLESASQVGGLAGSYLIDGRPVEYYYHFICQSDQDLLNLVRELDLESKLHWVQTKTSFFYQGKLYVFGTPIDLIQFKPISILERFRFGLNIIQSRYRKNWRTLDRISAKPWLTRQIGRKAYEVIWDPLLRIKFGTFHDRISAAWIWHRINRVASSRRNIWEREHLGYLQLGSETVIRALVQRIDQLPNVHIQLNERVKNIPIQHNKVEGVVLERNDQVIPSDIVVSTIALKALQRLIPEADDEYTNHLGQIDYLGVVCGLLVLKQPLTDSFWINIHDPEIPFNGIIEYGNLNQHLNFGGKSIVYIPYYLPTSEPRYQFSDEKLLSEFVDGLRRINPAFNESWIDEFHVSRAPFAQAICTVGFAELMPEHKSPIQGLYITDSSQFYPEDRTISAAIRLGSYVSELIQ